MKKRTLSMVESELVARMRQILAPDWPAMELRRPNRLVEKTPWGRRELVFHASKHHDGMNVSLHMMLRWTEVEEHLGGRSTLMWDVKNPRHLPLGWWCAVDQSSDVEALAQEMAAVVRERGLPEARRLAAPEAALAVLLDEDATGRAHCPLIGERALRAVLMARLVGGLPAAMAVAEQKRVVLAQRKPDELARFDALVNELGRMN